MSAAVMSSSLYDFNELFIKQQQQQQNDVGKLGWDSLSNDGETVMGRNLSLMTSFLLDNIANPHRRIERTQSEPTKTPSINVNTSSRYKTELCRPYEESGTCKYGDKCQFAHGGHELRCLVRHPKYKTELCRTFHSVGFCPYGPRCHFIHNADEARGNNNSTATVGGGSLVTSNKTTRPRPLTLETNTTPSPPSSQGSISPPPPYAFSATSGATITPPHSPPPPPASPERLPVFNRISAPNSHLLYNSMTLRFHGSELLV
uniref:Protein tis11-like isoform x2 n=1 Tax=Panstrongylus lignarius TaxID=156445 RepID=A0A224XUU5_9HEMI